MSQLRLKFGQRLRQLRRQRDMTQEQLAEVLGVSVEFVSNMERGVNAPSFDTLDKLSDALKLAVHEFFVFSDDAHA